MREINIARTIVNKRREKGWTQEALASHIGVSKASVSKWETGQSYPDITFLPQLASFFNISLDELMGYEPQMTMEDIRRLYRSLSSDFASKPFDEVLAHCREIIREYFACFPLLFQMGVLILNYCMTLEPVKTRMDTVREVKALFTRIKKESDDTELSHQARNMEAGCCLMLGAPDEAIALLENVSTQVTSIDTLLASAYQMTGRVKDAKAILQAGAYQHIVALLNILPLYLMLCADDAARYREVCHRMLALADTFKVKTLHPSMLMSFYITAAQGFVSLDCPDEALWLLEEYTALVTADIYPLRLHGDDFFDMIDEWLEQTLALREAPRDEKVVRQSMFDAVAKNPAFSALAEEPRLRSIIEKLKNNC